MKFLALASLLAVGSSIPLLNNGLHHRQEDESSSVSQTDSGPMGRPTDMPSGGAAGDGGYGPGAAQPTGGRGGRGGRGGQGGNGSGAARPSGSYGGHHSHSRGHHGQGSPIPTAVASGTDAMPTDNIRRYVRQANVIRQDGLAPFPTDATTDLFGPSPTGGHHRPHRSHSHHHPSGTGAFGPRPTGGYGGGSGSRPTRTRSAGGARPTGGSYGPGAGTGASGIATDDLPTTTATARGPGATARGTKTIDASASESLFPTTTVSGAGATVTNDMGEGPDGQMI